MSAVVYVLTAWNERTEEDVVQVFAAKAAAEKAWQKFEGRPEIYGAVYRRTVKR
ncbi:MAG: hypothetical protein ACXWCP_29240 [Burkholderiales bacterium]